MALLAHNMQQTYLDTPRLKLERGFTAKLQHAGSTISWSSKANLTAMKLPQRLTQQGSMIDSCPLYLTPPVRMVKMHTSAS